MRLKMNCLNVRSQPNIYMIRLYIIVTITKLGPLIIARSIRGGRGAGGTLIFLDKNIFLKFTYIKLNYIGVAPTTLLGSI